MKTDYNTKVENNTIMKRILKKREVSKLTKEQKAFMDVHGLTLKDTGDSEQGYLTVVGVNGRKLVCSKIRYTKEVAFFDPYVMVMYGNKNNVDLLSFVNAERIPSVVKEDKTKFEQMKELRKTVKRYEEYQLKAEAELEKIRMEYEKKVISHEKRIMEYEMKIAKNVKEIDEIKELINKG